MWYEIKFTEVFDHPETRAYLPRERAFGKSVEVCGARMVAVYFEDSPNLILTEEEVDSVSLVIGVVTTDESQELDKAFAEEMASDRSCRFPS